MVAAEHQTLEVLGEDALAVEVLDQTPLPSGRQVETGDQIDEQRDVADMDIGPAQAVMCRRLQAEREHLGVGRSYNFV